MKISRRDFLKWSAVVAIALNVDFDMGRVNTVLAAETDPPIIWLNGASCSGCTISMLNVTDPTTIDDVLLNKVSMKYSTTLMTTVGESAVKTLDDAANQYKGQFILVIEGSVPTGANGYYCVIGEQNGQAITMMDAVLKYGPMAKYVVSAGTCASFGGVPAAAPNNTSASTVQSLLNGKTINPIINLPGCPVHPTVLIQTLLDVILIGTPALDMSNRPTKYYGVMIHDICPRRPLPKVSQPGIYGCYMMIGCNGPMTKNVCPTFKWNNGQGWCVEVDHPCIGCANSNFPTNPLLKAGC